MISSVVSGIAVDTARDNVVVGSDAAWSAGLAIVDTTPSVTAWQASQSHTGATQTSTSGSGTGFTCSISTNGAGNPTFTVTAVGSGYSAGETIVFTDPGSTSNTATITLEEASTNNIAIGKDALNSTTSLGQGADNNVAIGVNALTALTTGDGNVAIGFDSLDATDDGIYNTGMGYRSLSANCGDENTAIGFQAGLAATGNQGTYVGAQCGDGITGGGGNTAVGFQALSAAADSYNVAMGYQAGLAITGQHNVIIGKGAMVTATAVDRCIVIGYEALKLANDDACDGTVAIGWSAGYQMVNTVTVSSHDDLAGNTLIGYSSGLSQEDSSKGLTTGSHNTAVGFETLGGGSAASITGSDNTVVGYRAGWSMAGAVNQNTLIGYKAGDTITVEDNNTIVGYNADAVAGAANTVALGWYASASQSFETAIGNRGGLRFVSKLVSCNLGGDTVNDPAHVTPICQIPRYGVVIKATAIIFDRNSDADHSLRLVLSTRATGINGTALTDVEEIIGVNATNSWSSHGAAGASKDIDVSSGGITYQSFAAVPYDPAGATDSGLATVDTTASGGKYVYLAFSTTGHTGGNSPPTANPAVLVTIEYVGIL